MTRQQIENLYIANGLHNFKLNNSYDLLKTHGIKINSIQGYNTLTEENRQLFEAFIVNIFNAWGLDSRSTLIPKAINYVEDIDYLVKESPQNDYYTVSGGIIKAILSNGNKKTLHRYNYKGYKGLEVTHGNPDLYLRFEYSHSGRNEWLHVINEHSWY